MRYTYIAMPISARRPSTGGRSRAPGEKTDLFSLHFQFAQTFASVLPIFSVTTTSVVCFISTTNQTSAPRQRITGVH